MAVANGISLIALNTQVAEQVNSLLESIRTQVNPPFPFWSVLCYSILGCLLSCVLNSHHLLLQCRLHSWHMTMPWCTSNTTWPSTMCGYGRSGVAYCHKWHAIAGAFCWNGQILRNDKHVCEQTLPEHSSTIGTDLDCNQHIWVLLAPWSQAACCIWHVSFESSHCSLHACIRPGILQRRLSAGHDAFAVCMHYCKRCMRHIFSHVRSMQAVHVLHSWDQ